jgi:hypothetical protein
VKPNQAVPGPDMPGQGAAAVDLQCHVGFPGLARDSKERRLLCRLGGFAQREVIHTGLFQRAQAVVAAALQLDDFEVLLDQLDRGDELGACRPCRYSSSGCWLEVVTSATQLNRSGSRASTWRRRYR